MEGMGDRLARRVAEAADAWLTDPRDTQTYQRLVDATLTWRAYSQPMLQGTERAGRRSPVAEPTPVPAASEEGPSPAGEPEARSSDGPDGPQRLGTLLEAVTGQLRGADADARTLDH